MEEPWDHLPGTMPGYWRCTEHQTSGWKPSVCDQCEIVRLRDALAEREAQIAQLTEIIREYRQDHEETADCFIGPGQHREEDRRCDTCRTVDALSDTAAHAFVERIQIEERERCAQIAERPRGIDLSASWENQADATGKRIAAAIRALGEK